MSPGILSRKLFVALTKSGFTVTTSRKMDVEWHIRKNMHRYMAGRNLCDCRHGIQIGKDEQTAKFYPMADLKQTNFAVTMLNPEKVPVWICGPEARWVATGNVEQFMKAMQTW